MNQLDTARQAISQEIRRLASEQSRLEKILEQLGGGSSGRATASIAAAVVATSPRKRGRPRKNPAPDVASASDVNGAVDLIEKAGKKGVKAIALAYQIKKAGFAKPDKQQLIDTQKVKMVGKGGASTYVYTG